MLFFLFFSKQKQGHWGESSNRTYFMSAIWLWLTCVRELSPPSLALQIKANLLFFAFHVCSYFVSFFVKERYGYPLHLRVLSFSFVVFTLLLCVKCKQAPYTRSVRVCFNFRMCVGVCFFAYHCASRVCIFPSLIFHHHRHHRNKKV